MQQIPTVNLVTQEKKGQDQIGPNKASYRNYFQQTKESNLELSDKI